MSSGSSARCKATTASGAPCRAAPLASGYCFMHDPGSGTARAQARRRGGQRTRVPHSTTTAPAATVQTLDDARAILAYGLAEALVMENSIARGRLLVAIAQAAIEAWKIGELEQRMAAIEALMKGGDFHGSNGNH